MSILTKVCCCCCQLTTAAVLLGWLGSVGYFITVVSIIMAMIDAPNHAETRKVIDIMRMVVLVVTLLISFLNLVGCACLIVGAVKKIRHLILPWLFSQIVFIVVLIITDIIFLANLLGHDRTNIVPPFCLLTTYLAFQIYFWICVYSLFREIRGDDDDTQQQTDEIETRNKSTSHNDDLPSYASLA